MTKHIGILESNLSGSGFEGLRIAKQAGLRVTFFTRDLERYLKIPGGRRYFDEYVDDIVRCETNVVDRLVPYVTAVHARDPLTAFLSMGEYDVVQAARVAALLCLPTVDPQAVEVARNKVLMRRRCASRAVPMPRFAAVGTTEEALSAARRIGLPCVVKPADETSSTDVARCHTLDVVARQVERITAKPLNTRFQERYPLLLVEECLHGFEVSVEVLAQGEEHVVLGVTDKSVSGTDRFVEVGHVFPSVLPEPMVAACAEVATSALRAVGFDRGRAHVEVKVTDSGPRLIEINPRPAGDRITDLVDLSLDASCLEFMVRQYLGEHVAVATPVTPVRGAAIRYLTGWPGQVKAVRGLDIARRMNGVREAVLKVRPGDVIGYAEHNMDRLGHVLAVAESAYLADRIAAAALHEIVVTT
jgi:biotin carboxylase